MNDNIETTTIHGRLIFNIFASFAEFERELISERTKAGLEAARKKGRIGGRKPGLSKDAIKKAHVVLACDTSGMPVSDTLKQLKISKSTYYRYLQYAMDNPSTKLNKRST